jgi:hypothetical protein
MDDSVKLAVVAGASAGLAYWLLSSSNCSQQAKIHSMCSTAAEIVSCGSEEACAAKAKQGPLLSSVSLLGPILDLVDGVVIFSSHPGHSSLISMKGSHHLQSC